MKTKLLSGIFFQVREHRKARDEERQRKLQHRRQQKEAWQEAERLVREGEREEGRRRGREERLVAEIIRHQVQAETERKRRQVTHTHTHTYTHIILDTSYECTDYILYYTNVLCVCQPFCPL